MTTDPIADYLTRIRNALQARHNVVEIPASNTKKAITKVLHEQGYIRNYMVDEASSPQGTIKIALKYNSATKKPTIVKLARVSRPGLQLFSKSKALPEVINGLGIAIISTSQGIMTNKEARKKNIGGEVLCYVY